MDKQLEAATKWAFDLGFTLRRQGVPATAMNTSYLTGKERKAFKAGCEFWETLVETPKERKGKK